MTTTQRRHGVTHLQAAHGYSARRAGALVGLARPQRDAPVVTRLLALAAARLRFSNERLTLLLRREGLVVNHKRVHRLVVQSRDAAWLLVPGRGVWGCAMRPTR